VTGGLVARQRADGTIEANYLGFPVRFSGKLPDVPTTLATKPMLYFGNLAMSSVLVERNQQTIIALSQHRALDTEQIRGRPSGCLIVTNNALSADFEKSKKGAHAKDALIVECGRRPVTALGLLLRARMPPRGSPATRLMASGGKRVRALSRRPGGR